MVTVSYFHVQIILKAAPTRDEWAVDLSRDELNQRFVEPYKAGQPIGIDGSWISPEDIDRIRVYQSKDDSAALGRRYSASELGRGIISIRPSSLSGIEIYGDDVTADIITTPPGTANAPVSVPEAAVAASSPTDRQKVFVVHGRNSAVRDAMFSFLRAIGLKPIEWSEAVLATGRPTPYIGDILDAAFSQAQAVVVLLTPDDEARLRPKFAQGDDPPHERELSGQARPNVLFEAGMAMGRNSERTVLVEIGRLRPFSDIAGRHVVRLDDSTQRRQELAQRLQAAGCEVNLEGTDWHTMGEFKIE